MTERAYALAGEMGRRISERDWSETPLGPIHDWPQSLKTAVSIMLTSRYPMFVWWGDELIHLYNDGYIPILGARHPAALGGPARRVWHEIWADVGPQAELALNEAQSTWQEQRLLLMQRNEYIEETYFTYSYSPLRDDHGRVCGVFCACLEETQRVLHERRLHVLRRISDVSAEATSEREALDRIAAVLAESDRDVSFAQLYLLDAAQGRLDLAADTGIPEGAAAAPARIDLAAPIAGRWSFEPTLAGGAHTVELSPEDALPGGAWPEPAVAARMLPITTASGGRPTGVLIVGLSPRRRMDDGYARFLDLLASGVSAALSSARAFEAERQRSEVLAEIDRAKTAFFSNVSHEFRTPLTLMLAPLESAADDREVELSAEDVEQVRRNGERMLKLVNTMLDFARIEAGRSDALFEPIDLAAAVTDLASAFRSTIEAAGLAFVVDAEPLDAPVHVDRGMLEKIVFNLLSNALKHTFEGEIRLRVRREGDDAVLSVTDTGTGIPADELPHVFDRFHRVRGVRSRSHEGTGIGLALVREMVRQHGGRIDVRSDVAEDGAGGAGGIPGGSEFAVRLPIGTEHLPADRIGVSREPHDALVAARPYLSEALRWSDRREAPETVAAASSLTPAAARHEGPAPRLLIADDNADMRDYLGRLFRGAGYEVSAVSDGTEALDAIEAARPALVLADVMMPGLDGLALTRRLRAAGATRSVPIILLSARASDEARLEGLEAGASDYVVKPFSARELVARVGGLVELSRVRADAARRERRIRAEAVSAVRELEERFRRMADSAPMMIWVTDGDGRATFLSRSWYEFTGQDESEGLGGGWLHAVHPEDRDGIRSAFDEASAERGPFATEYRLRRADGAYRWVLDSATAYVDEQGTFHGYVGTVVDITGRREAETALRQSEERFRTLANSIPQLAWMARPDGHIFWYNKRWYDYTGTTFEEMEGWGWQSVHDADELPRVLEHFKASIASGSPWEDTFPLRRHDGAMRWHLSRALPLRDEAGEIALWFGTNTDITDRREMEEALREADRRKDQFLATLAHELRNPLAPLAHGLEMLQLASDGASARRIRETMERQLENLVRLVDELLDVSRVSLGKVQIQAGRVELGDVVRAAIETARPEVVAHGHALHLDLPDEKLELIGDRTRLEQVFANLLHNAAKYTPDGGNIRVSARTDGGADPGAEAGIVRVAVEDDGIGIPAELQARVFDLFAQAEETGYGPSEGLGIGLTLVRQLVDLHGGTVEVESEGVGKGSRFTVALPLAPALVAADAATATAASNGSAARETSRRNGGDRGGPVGPRRVLVVDDNANAAEMLTILLEVLGHDVQTAADGYQALEMGPLFKPDVIFLDIGLPRLNGYETCRLIRQRDWGKEVRIVAVTGWGQDEDKRRSEEAGFDVHLVKPVKPDVLKEMLV